jgi:hypothetical protein
MITFSKYFDIVSKIAKKLDISKDIALAVLHKAQEKGIDPVKWNSYISMLNTFVRMVASEYDPELEEEVKAESVLKWILSGRTLSDARKMRDKVIKENPKYKPISDKDLHITLAEYDKFQSSPKRKKYRAELNKYNRQKGTYGNKDKKDASHRNGKIVGFEDEGENRGRSEKSRIKGSVRKPFNEKKYKQN